MKIKNSLDWQECETELKHKIAYIKDKQKQIEAKRILKNFDAMITTLSLLELSARRSSSHSQRKVNEQLDIINTEILALEQWITLLLLM